MHSTFRYRVGRRALAGPIAVLATAGLIAAGCGGKSNQPAAATSLQREPVNFAGANPFTPPVGTDRPGVTHPANAGGTVQANTAGLFGGTQNVATCNPQQMVTFLQATPAKATAWAGVLGISVSDIPTFVSGLTSVVLRTDTAVTNHGFVNGRATTIPAVLQAGTAVLVDKSGALVTKCFCGNPLTAPTSFQKVTFVGPSWTSFSSTSVTIISSTVSVINQFTLVEPVTGLAFDRRTGSNGTADGPATATPVLPPPVPPPPGSVPSTVAPPTATPPPAAPTTVTPTTVTPTTVTPSAVAPSSAAPSTRPPSSRPAPTTPPTASAPAVPPPVVPPASPSATATPSATPTPTPTPTNSAPPTSAPTVTTSWLVGGCFTDRTSTPPTLRATVLIRNNDPTNPHSYALIVEFGPSGSFGKVTVTVPSVQPNQTAKVDVSTPAVATVPVDIPSCAIASIVNETGQKPLRGPALPPPPDVTPQPTTPSITPTALTPSETSPDESPQVSPT